MTESLASSCSVGLILLLLLINHSRTKTRKKKKFDLSLVRRKRKRKRKNLSLLPLLFAFWIVYSRCLSLSVSVSPVESIVVLLLASMRCLCVRKRLVVALLTSLGLLLSTVIQTNFSITNALILNPRDGDDLPSDLSPPSREVRPTISLPLFDVRCCDI